MCFAFRLKSQLERNTIRYEEEHIDRLCFVAASMPTNTAPTPTAHKRAASTSIEGSPKKVAKWSDDEPQESSNSFIDVEGRSVPVDVGQSDSANALRDLQKRIAELEEKLEESENSAHEWRMSAVGLHDEVKELNTKLAALKKAKPLTVEASKRLEATIKEDYDAKFVKMTTDINKKLENKKEMYKTALERRDAKHKSLLQTEKEHQKSKDKEYKETLAELKATHKEEVAKLRPGHTKIVKEMEQFEKEKEAEIAALKKAVACLQSREQDLEEVNEDLDKKLKASERKNVTRDQEIDDAKSTLNEHLQDYRKMIRLKGQWEANEVEYLEKLAGVEAREDEYKVRLKHEGERWQMQFNKVCNLERTILEQHRSNAVLRDSNERRTQQVKALERKIEELESKHGHTEPDYGQILATDVKEEPGSVDAKE